MRKSSKPQRQTLLPMPIAYYEFAGNANDMIGGVNGTITGGSFTNDRNNTPSEAYLTGGERIDGLKIITGTNPRTYILMVNCTQNETAGDYQPLFTTGSTSIGQLFEISAGFSTNSSFTLNVSGFGRDTNGVNIYNVGTYIQIAVTYENGVGVRIYANGMLDVSNNVSLNTGTTYNNIGKKRYIYNNRYWKYDYLAVYNKALSAGAISDIYNGSVPYLF